MPSCRTLRDRNRLSRKKQKNRRRNSTLSTGGASPALARKIREDLAREKDARINELRAETEDQLSRLDAYYEAHHESLCSELFQKITGITET